MFKRKLLDLKNQIHKKVYDDKIFNFKNEDLKDILIITACPSSHSEGSLVRLITSDFDTDYSFIDRDEIRIGFCKNYYETKYIPIEEEALEDPFVNNPDIGYFLCFILKDFFRNSFVVEIIRNNQNKENSSLWNISIHTDKNYFYEKFTLYMDEDKKTFVEGYIVDLSFLKYK